MSVLQIFMFGGLRILVDGEVLPPFPTRKTRSLFAYLVAYRQRSHARQVLAGMFWGDMPEDRAQRNLSTTLWRLRRALPPGYLHPDESELAFNTAAPYWLDVAQFEKELSLAATAAEATPHLQTAIQLYRGDFLQGLYDDWLLVEAERLRLGYQHALQRLFSIYKGHKQWQQALTFGQQLLALDPLREDVHLGMMELYQQMGQRSAALAQYQRCRQILRQELAVEPLPETQALYRQLLNTPVSGPTLAPSPSGPAPPAILPRTPFDDFGQAPWVGRKQELALMKRQLRRIGQGESGIVLVGGVAGVGKTRLAEQVASLAQVEGVLPLWGICPDLQEPPPYQGLVEIMQKGLSVLDPASLPPWLGELTCLLPELRHRFPRFRPLAPDPDDTSNRVRLLPAIWQLLRTITAQTPCLLLLEDIHWADAATLETLRYLLPHLRQANLLFLLTFRPEELPGHAVVADTLLTLEASGLSTRINLAPLTATETARLVQQALGLPDPHPVLGPLIYRETEGNPFFIGEVLKALVEEKQLYLDPQHGWRTPWDEAELPSTFAPQALGLTLPRGIRRLVEHRLARLSPSGRRLLAQLAVLGREIDYDVLFHVCNVEEETLLATTDQLLHRHLLVETEAGLRFSHDKIRQTVYEGLSQPWRRYYHRRAGETLIHLYPDRVEELAHHFHQAQDHARTLDYALAAAERARHLYANQAALTYYGWAIAAAPHLNDEAAARALISAHEHRGRIYRQLAAAEQAVAEYEAMLAAAEAVGDGSAMARAVRLAGWMQGNLQGDWELGLQQACRAQHLAQEAHDRREEAAAMRDMGAYHNLRGEYRQALSCQNIALAKFRQLQDQRGEASALHHLAVTHHFLNQYAAAVDTYAQALTLWRALGDRMAELKVLANLGYVLISDGRFTAASDAFAQAEITLREIDATSLHAWVRIGQAAIARYQGHDQNCLHILETTAEELTDTDYLRALVAQHKGMALWQSGDLPPAIYSLQKALSLARTSDTPSLVIGVLNELGRCWRQLGDVATARRLHHQASTLAQTEGRMPVIVTLQSELGLDEILLDARREGIDRLRHAAAKATPLPRWNRAEVLLNLSVGLLAMPSSVDKVGSAQQALAAATALGVHAYRLQGYLLLGRALADQGCWAEAETALQAGLALQPVEGALLARGRMLSVLARVQLGLGHKETAAATQAQAQHMLDGIAASLPDPGQIRRWHTHLQQVETRLSGIAASVHGRICILLPRRDARGPRAVVTWTTDAGPADEAVRQAQGKVALRWARVRRLWAEAAQQNALVPEAELAAALGVSVRTIKRDIAALRRLGELEIELQAAMKADNCPGK